MKTLLLATLILFVFVTNIFCQTIYKEEVDAIQAVFGKEKREMIKELIKMTPQEEEKFWPVYDEYEAKRKELGYQRIMLLEKIAKFYNDPNSYTPELADNLQNENVKIIRANDDLIAKYYTKMKKATGNVLLSIYFYQAELYILTEIRMEIMSSIPHFSTVKPKDSIVKTTNL